MKAVVFDFNGTLYNDTRFHIAAWTNFFRRRGVEMTEQEVRAKCIGPGNIDIFRAHISPDLPMDEMKRLSEDKEREYRAVAGSREEYRALVPGTEKMLNALKERGIPFALATASPIENVEFYLDTLGLNRWFTLDNIVYDNDTLACKPAPDFYLEAMRRLNARPEETVIVEDSKTGLLSARNARAGRIVMRDETVPLEFLRAQDDIYAIIHDYSDFDSFLGDLGKEG